MQLSWDGVGSECEGSAKPSLAMSHQSPPPLVPDAEVLHKVWDGHDPMLHVLTASRLREIWKGAWRLVSITIHEAWMAPVQRFALVF